MRGKERQRLCTYIVARITPAYAGKRQAGKAAGLASRDHPCVCGEKFETVPCLVLDDGSPLRMRGKETCYSLVQSTMRITPAYAGKRYTRRTTGLSARDHPCVCGEKLTVAVSISIIIRITPAYAGKSYLSWTPYPYLWDHPCVCGEKQHRVYILNSRVGITPAYAGKSPVPILRNHVF